MCNRIWIMIAMFYFVASQALAAIPEQYNLTNAWFKPYLVTDRNPALCQTLLRDYEDYFSTLSPSQDPLALVRGQGAESSDVSSASELDALEWKDVELGRYNLRIAEWQEGDNYLSLVEREEWIGWRGPFYGYVLLGKRFSDSNITDSNIEDYFKEHGLSSLAASGDEAYQFEVLTKSDPRSREYDSNTFISVQNIFRYNGSVYFAATTSKPSSGTYLIFDVRDYQQFELNCRLATRPTEKQILEQEAYLSDYSDLKQTLSEIMGGAGNCGTLNSHSRASGALRDALTLITYRPWIVVDINSNDLAKQSTSIEASLKLWGYSGIWNHGKYVKYRELLPRAKTELASLFADNYGLEAREADELARRALDGALTAGFSFDSVVHRDYRFQKMLLDGINRDELENISYDPDVDRLRGDSILTFAIKDPKALAVLLREGFDPDKANAFGKTPLMYAAQFSQLESAKLLVEYGAQLELTTVDSGDRCYYTIQTKGVSALHYAVRYASAAFIEWLVAQGAPTYIKDSNGFTPSDYLSAFGGFVGYRQKAETTYGEQNPRLTQDQKDRLRIVLTPPDSEQFSELSRAENQKAEAFYREGNVKKSYTTLRRALELDPLNERALSNMSLAALRLGRLGEAAKAATLVMQTASSDEKKASANFNLGLACREAARDGSAGAVIIYDGKRYCMVDRWVYGGPLHFFLASYALNPTERARNSILELFNESDQRYRSDQKYKRRLCRATTPDATVRSIFISGYYITFLVRAGSKLPYESAVSRYGNRETTLNVQSSTSVSLGSEFTLFRWRLDEPTRGSLVFGSDVCGRAFTKTFGTNTRLIELYAKSSFVDSIRIETELNRPTILILYGNYLEWRAIDSMNNVIGVFLKGRGSNFVRSENADIEVYIEDWKSAYYPPLESSFNRSTPTIVGLTIDRIVEIRSPGFVLTDGESR